MSRLSLLAGFLRGPVLVYALPLALASLLVLPNLGGGVLWQDEAQSALLARSVLEHGVPHGRDGLNSFSQELGAEIDDSGVWRWHTWLHFYAVAGSFALLGESEFAARLPAALAGIATVAASAALGGALWGTRGAALAAGIALAGSLPFAILARQCRWYTPAALFSVMALLGQLRVVRAQRGGAWLLAGSLIGLFHTHFAYVPPLVAGLGVHAALYGRARWRPLAGAMAAAALVCAPWIFWQAGMDYGPYAQELGDPGRAPAAAALSVGKLLRFAFPAWLVLVVALVAGVEAARGRFRANLQPWVLLGSVIALTLATLSITSPGAFFRYLAPLLPLCAVAAGGVAAAAGRIHPLLGAAVVLGLLAGQPFRDYAHELRGEVAGPITGLVSYLRERAQPGEVVLISYGDMPLKFYTPLRVLGGLTGEDLESARDAEWVVPRHHVVHEERDGAVLRFIRSEVDWDKYRKIELPFTDTTFENREEPTEHRFRSARGGPPVTLYRRVR